MGLWQFLTGTRWAPSKGVLGILPMIVGSFLVTAGALLIGLPLGLGCAIYLSEFAPRQTALLLKPTIELLAGIPSVVFGFIGLTLIVPFIRNYFGGPGFSVLASALVLSIMILPTMVSVSYDALRAVPPAYREGMLALGATDWQAVKMVVLPAARPGILAAAILAMGRAVGRLWRDHGSRQLYHYSHFLFGSGADHDLQHRTGNGLRHPFAPAGYLPPE